MVILSYISLVLCVHFYAVHVVSLLEVFALRQDGRGEIPLLFGHFFLMSCVYFASTYGWTF